MYPGKRSILENLVKVFLLVATLCKVRSYSFSVCVFPQFRSEHTDVLKAWHTDFFFLAKVLIDGEKNFYLYTWECASTGFQSEEQMNFKMYHGLQDNMYKSNSFFLLRIAKFPIV